ncbi:MAG: SDR family NAD(P)-dependent oxidoreductase [Gammaproteobacteria bacterium]
MKNIAIIGATGAIGTALIERLLFCGEDNNLYLYTRTPVLWQHQRIQSYSLDICDERSIEQASAQLNENRLDLIIIATGVLHDAVTKPEKSYIELEKGNLEKLFLVNTIGPALLLKFFLPLMKKNVPVCCALLSAKVGSIGDNYLGGWYSYRMSKAALNMLIKTASIEFKRKNPQGTIIGLHPGTVTSPLSQPYLDKINHTIFSPSEAAELMLKVITSVQPEDSGYTLSYDGKRLPF